MVGERIREARLAQNRSLADVAGKAQISVATLSRIENAKQSVEVGLFLLLARVLSIPAHELLGTQEAEEHGNGNGNGNGHSKLDPLVRRIASLGPADRLELWKELAAERRTQRGRARGSESRQMAQHVEELLAQVDFLREELEGVRKKIKRR
ncbi:MAG TPA: helix-turn-helix transcriptional regulator [Thermoanaerobaculia bacterium]|nr:helix-turn-helix transcriptional regulator [Thermoanaerobaculia bacterium]